MTETRRVADIQVGERHRKDLGDIPTLADSIQKVGLLQPVVVTPDNRLVAGQRRLAACQRLGWLDIPVHVVNIQHLVLGEAAENQFRKDFLPSEIAAIARACWDVEAKDAEERKLAALKRGNERPDMATFPHEKGKTRDKIARCFGISGKTLYKIQAVMDGPDDDLKELLDRKRRVDRVYQMLLQRRKVEEVAREQPSVLLNGAVRPDSIVHGDCRLLLKDVPDATFHAVVTDPPFGIGLDYGEWKEEADNPHDYWRWFGPIYKELWRVLKPGGFLCIWQSATYIPWFGRWYGDKFKVHAFCQSSLRMCFKREKPWQYAWQPGLMWYKEGAKPLTALKPTWTLDYFQSACDHDEFACQHPTPKPLDLCEAIVSSFVVDGGYVLDAFCGSGTVPLACARTGRHYVGIDVAANFCRLAQNRIAQYGRKEAEDVA